MAARHIIVWTDARYIVVCGRMRTDARYIVVCRRMRTDGRYIVLCALVIWTPSQHVDTHIAI